MIRSAASFVTSVALLAGASASVACGDDPDRDDPSSAATGSGGETSGTGGGGAAAASTGAGGASASTVGTGGAVGQGGSSSSSAGGGPPQCAAAAVSGSTTETIVVGGVDRTYLVIVPASLQGSTAPAPVLLGFHGGNGTSEYASQTYGLTGDEAMVYVYPQAPYWREAGGVAWDVDQNGVDFPYFDAMLADLGQKYCIDAARVFAAGQSNGGFFVNALGCYRPEALRAIAPVAGGGPPGQCTPSTVTVMAVHGSGDTTVPVTSGMYARDYWLEANGCAGAASAPVDPSPCVQYAGCAEPVLWCEHPGGHSWPAFAGPAIRGFFLSL
jgi:polyhydroxybutyrate depolymerase